MTNSESTSSKKYPCVVIAGRPNVGKSTLFNRFLRKRRAITDPIPGVTRDPISAECDLGGSRVLITDTGAIDYSKDGFEIGIETLVKNKGTWPDMAERMKRLYFDEYSWTIMEMRLIELYDSV